MANNVCLYTVGCPDEGQISHSLWVLLLLWSFKAATAAEPTTKLRHRNRSHDLQDAQVRDLHWTRLPSSSAFHRYDKQQVTSHLYH